MTTARSPGGRGRTRPTKRRAQLLAGFVGTPLLTLGLWIGAPTPASAILGDSCSGLDTSCLTQSVRDGAVEVTRGAGDAARDVGDEVGTTVEGTIDAVDRVLGAASSGVPAPGGGAGGDDGPGGRNDGGGKPHTGGSDHENGPSDRSRNDGGRAPGAIVVPNPPPIVHFGPPIPHAEVPVPSTGAGTDGGLGVGRLAADIGHRLALPLAFMLALVVAFVAMQKRLDRTDPQLLLASLDEEVSRFR